MVTTQTSTTRTPYNHAFPSAISGLENLRLEAKQCGLDHLWNDFESRIPDLFVDDTTESRVGKVIDGRDHIIWATNRDKLLDTLGKGISETFILQRYNSWSRIGITVDLFSALCQLAGPTPYFLNLVIGMGRKFNSKDEDFMSCYSTVSSTSRLSSNASTCGETCWKICYNIRYFEQHGRDLEDPWSCRQSAIHNSFSTSSNKSTWVIIQPPEALNVITDLKGHPLSLHTRYLTAGFANWRQYLDTFAQEFRMLNRHIAMPSPYKKFQVDFIHQQQLQNSRGKLSHALNILTNMQDTLRRIGIHSKAMIHAKDIPAADNIEFQQELDNLSRETRCHIRTAQKLLRTSNDLKSMYDNILTFRGQELQHETSLKLTQLVQADAVENKDMAMLANLTYRDSRTMRIATVIAMFYLPANLVMSFFSSTLVWFGTSVDVSENYGSKLQVRGEVWIATVSTLVLAAATIGWSWWWNSREQRKSSNTSHQSP